MNKKQLLVTLLIMAVLVAASVMPGPQLAGTMVERLTNGGFEEGFYATPTGSVGSGWSWFDSGGGAKYGFYPDTWAPVISEGTSSQLIEIDTVGQTGAEAPHYAGIYQTVAVVPGTTYEFTLHGMLRALEDDPDRANYSYRVQYGIDYNGGTEWQQIDNWVEIPWDTVYPRLSPGPLGSYSAQVVATGPRLTLFVRVWYKWRTIRRELDVNLDDISLTGALPGTSAGSAQGSSAKPYTVVKGSGSSRVVIGPGTVSSGGKLSVSFDPPAFPVAGWEYKIQVTGTSDVGVTRLELYDNRRLVERSEHQVGLLLFSHEFNWKPGARGSHVLKAVAYDALGAQAVQQVSVKVGYAAQFVVNGSLEQGFVRSLAGLVGKGWSAFDNGGRAEYGFYEETWAPVVYDGAHSQLIEISTKQQGASDPDRYAGIFQTASGLTQGATYRFSVKGMLRALASDMDRQGYNYRVQWGYVAGKASDWTLVNNWIEIPWDTVYSRLDPGVMQSYDGSFAAPAGQVTLFIRAWKKWGTVARELDVNLDAISLVGYKR